MKLAPIQSIAQLRSKAFRDENYKRLALVSAENLGGDPNGNLNEAIRWLEVNASESEDELGVVEEINACRDMVNDMGGQEDPQ